jgi:hypothetical protein
MGALKLKSEVLLLFNFYFRREITRMKAKQRRRNCLLAEKKA